MWTDSGMQVTWTNTLVEYTGQKNKRIDISRDFSRNNIIIKYQNLRNNLLINIYVSSPSLRAHFANNLKYLRNNVMVLSNMSNCHRYEAP